MKLIKSILLFSILVLSNNMVMAEKSFVDDMFKLKTKYMKDSSGFGGPMIGTTKMFGRDQVMIGGSGGAILDGFIVGGGGKTIGFDVNTNSLSSGGNAMRIGMGYGGLILGFQTSPKDRVQLSISSLFGIGGILLKEATKENQTDEFTIVEPELSLIFKFNNFLRIKASVSERLIGHYSVKEIPKAALENKAYWIHFEFGNYSS